MSNNKFWNEVVIVIVALGCLIIFILPYRGALLSNKPLPIELQGYTTPSKKILDEVLIVSQADTEHYISYYDELFREIAVQHDIHWCLISAIAYVESRFKAHAQSSTGAIGLMQIMPRIGRSLGVEPVDLFDPEVNVRTAILHYRDIERMLKIPQKTSRRDRISLILASYNGGIGRVFDAQRLARSAGGDPHKWADVSQGLLDLRFIDDDTPNELVRFGSFKTARYTVRYVKDVLTKYEEYLERTAESSLHLYPYALHYERMIELGSN